MRRGSIWTKVQVASLLAQAKEQGRYRYLRSSKVSKEEVARELPPSIT